MGILAALGMLIALPALIIGTVAAVPAPPIQVPGSWKQASIRWDWVERAQAYDLYFITKTVEETLEEAATTDLTFPFDRVLALKSMFEAVRKAYNENTRKTPEQVCAYVARMQSILRDIREEMKLHNQDVARLVLTARTKQASQEQSEKQVKALESSSMPIPSDHPLA
jgi:hypothetical protein